MTNQTTTSGELRECPFHDYPSSVNADDDVISQRWRIYCGACGASSGSYPTRGKAVTAWNDRRPAPPPQASATRQGDLVDALFGLACNVNGGDLSKQTPEWREAFDRARDEYARRAPSMQSSAPSPHAAQAGDAFDEFADSVSYDATVMYGVSEFAAELRRVDREATARCEQALAEARTAVATLTRERDEAVADRREVINVAEKRMHQLWALRDRLARALEVAEWAMSWCLIQLEPYRVKCVACGAAHRRSGHGDERKDITHCNDCEYVKHASTLRELRGEQAKEQANAGERADMSGITTPAASGSDQDGSAQLSGSGPPASPQTGGVSASPSLAEADEPEIVAKFRDVVANYGSCDRHDAQAMDATMKALAKFAHDNWGPIVNALELALAPPLSFSPAVAEAGTISADMLTRCETTGMAAHKGSCLAHGGDACLWYLPNLRHAWNQHVAEIATLRAALEQRGAFSCRVCGCVWRRNNDGTWSLFNGKQQPGPCCDNSPDFLANIGAI